MKALSLWQPWANAIATGLKKFETRSWKCPASMIGKPLAIHAAKKRDWVGKMRWTQYKLGIAPTLELPENLTKEQEAIFKTGVEEYGHMSFGEVVALATVVKCWKTEEAREVRGLISQDEYNWGNYTSGNYCWELKVFYVFKKPIPCKGMQGIFNWEIPEEWMEKAAEEAGMSEMLEIWKAMR